MFSFFGWNRGLLFHRKSLSRAVLQGGAIVGMVCTAYHALHDPNASFLDISNALTILAFAYGNLGENPSMFYSICNYVAGSVGVDCLRQRSLNSISTLPKTLSASVSVISLLSIFVPLLFLNGDDHDNHRTFEGERNAPT